MGRRERGEGGAPGPWARASRVLRGRDNGRRKEEFDIRVS